MFLLNPSLLWGLAAAAAPLLIHFLFRRRRAAPLEWGAMRFLEELVAEESRALRFRAWLLLLVRIALLACLVSAMLRPAVRLAAPLPGAPRERVSAVILMDDSFSMRAGRPQSAWQEAQLRALQYLETLRPGDDVALLRVCAAGREAPAALHDLGRARELLRAAQPGYGEADWPRAIAEALPYLEGRFNPRRELLVVSDLQSAGWRLNDGSRWEFIARLRAASRLPARVLIAGVRPEPPANAALVELLPSRQVIDTQSPVQFQAAVANSGGADLEKVAVTFLVDGTPKTTQTVDLRRGEQRGLGFVHRFDRAGSHYVGARLRSAQDELAEDDEFLLSLAVVDRLPVLVVDGDAGAGGQAPPANAAALLRLALAPPAAEGGDWRPIIRPSVLSPAELQGADLSAFRAVALVNVAALPGREVSELERFVVDGGGLLIVPGPNAQPENYNRELFRQGAGLLPAALPAPESETVPARLGAASSGAPALDLFRTGQAGDWSPARILRRFPLSMPESGTASRALAGYADGRPAIVQKSLGEGRVTLLTTGLQSDWSDLASQPFFVPLMQGLVFDLAAPLVPPRNLRSGQPLVHAALGTEALRPHLVYPPSPGPPAPMTPRRQGAVTFFVWERTEQTGLYACAPEEAGSEERVFYCVTPPPAESRLDRLDAAGLARLTQTGFLDAEFLAKESAAGAPVSGPSFLELAPVCVLAALGLALLEVALARRWN